MGSANFSLMRLNSFEQIHDRLHAFFDDLFDGFGVVELRFLFEQPYRVARLKEWSPR